MLVSGQKKRKKSIGQKREELLRNLLNKHKSNGSRYDCITTVSGGKDGSYVSYNIKHKYKMDPLAVTFRPIMETEIGKKIFIHLLIVVMIICMFHLIKKQ